MNAAAPTPPGRSLANHPFPWALLRHWALRYVTLWILLALVILIVQLVLAAVLHEREEVVNFLRILDKLPKIFKALIGGDELMPSNVLSIVAIGYQHPLILTMLMINAITVPTGLLTAQCEQGAMEHLLARPVTRSRIYGLTLVLALASQATLVWMVFLGTAVWTRVFDYGEPIPLEGFARVSVNLTALACCVVGLASLVAVYFNERNRAIGVIVGYLVGSYLLDFASVWLPSLGRIHPFTLFYYCVPNAVLKAGELPWPHLAMLFTVGAGSAVAGWLYWRVRDIFAV